MYRFFNEHYLGHVGLAVCTEITVSTILMKTSQCHIPVERGRSSLQSQGIREIVRT